MRIEFQTRGGPIYSFCLDRSRLVVPFGVRHAEKRIDSNECLSSGILNFQDYLLQGDIGQLQKRKDGVTPSSTFFR
jgi:hypothetical protein